VIENEQRKIRAVLTNDVSISRLCVGVRVSCMGANHYHDYHDHHGYDGNHHRNHYRNHHRNHYRNHHRNDNGYGGYHRHYLPESSTGA
jgi:hypothetical protein